MAIKLSDFVYLVEELCRKEKNDFNKDTKLSITAESDHWTAKISYPEGNSVVIETKFENPPPKGGVKYDDYGQAEIPVPKLNIIHEDGLGSIALCTDKVEPIDTIDTKAINEDNKVSTDTLKSMLDKVEASPIRMNSLPEVEGEISVYDRYHIDWFQIADSPFNFLGFIKDENIKANDFIALNNSRDMNVCITDGIILITAADNTECCNLIKCNNARPKDMYISAKRDLLAKPKHDLAVYLTYSTNWTMALHDTVKDFHHTAFCITISHDLITKSTKSIELYDIEFNRIPSAVFKCKDKFANIMVISKTNNDERLLPAYCIIAYGEDYGKEI